MRWFSYDIKVKLLITEHCLIIFQLHFNKYINYYLIDCYFSIFASIRNKEISFIHKLSFRTLVLIIYVLPGLQYVIRLFKRKAHECHAWPHAGELHGLREELI